MEPGAVVGWLKDTDGLRNQLKNYILADDINNVIYMLQLNRSVNNLIKEEHIFLFKVNNFVHLQTPNTTQPTIKQKTSNGNS